MSIHDWKSYHDDYKFSHLISVNFKVEVRNRDFRMVIFTRSVLNRKI